MSKRLERDVENKVLAGVLSGLAGYFNQDPVLFRFLAIMFLIITGIFPGLLFYLVGWMIMPQQKARKADYEVVE